MDTFSIPNIGEINKKEYLWARNLAFSFDEINKVRDEHLKLWYKYLNLYQGKSLSLEWKAKKGNDIFWFGMKTPHTFFEKYDIKFFPKKWKNKTIYQIDYYQIEVFEDKIFQYASNYEGRKLLYDKKTTHEAFYDFSLGLNIISTIKLYGANNE